ncbi:MAG: ABC transporter permease [Verrucomicrobiales bacterium]|nr:ABC transporter permease [Verrucomicrobiales bacterium]
MNDFRFAIRQFAKKPGYADVVVVTLALGIGVNTAKFSIVNGTLIGPLRYPDSERLVRVFRTSPQSQDWPHSPANFLDHQEMNQVFSSTTAYTWWPFNLTGTEGPPDRVSGVLATGDFFRTLGVNAAVGRVFTSEDDAPGRNQVVVISHGFWQRRYGADPAVCGRLLRLDGESATVIGVMPPDFGHRLFNSVDVWKPMGWTGEQRAERGNNYLSEIARLKPGVFLSAAQADMDGLAARLATAYPGNNAGIGLRVISLRESATDPSNRRMLWIASALTLCVLLIACLNLANLHLTRLISRSSELGVRAALGAGSGRLAWQLMLESLILSVFGLGLAVLINVAVLPAAERYLRVVDQDPSLEFPVNGLVLGFSVACAGVATVLSNLIPTWLALRAGTRAILNLKGRGGTEGMFHRRLQSTLIVGEVAFALTLLCGAGVLLQGLHGFQRRDQGWEVDGLLTGQLALSAANYESVRARSDFADQLIQRLAVLPGVRQVAIGSMLPIWGFGSADFAVEGRAPPDPGTFPLAFRETISPGYFATMGMRLKEGRDFESNDTTNRPAVIIINEGMARHFWPGQSPLGKRVGSGDPQDPRWEEVIGVVNDLRFPGNLRGPDTAFQIYRPIAQQSQRWFTILLRHDGAIEPLARTLRQTVAGLDPGLPVAEVVTARSQVDRQLAHAGLVSRALGVFAGLGLGLAGLGIYGVLDYSVSRRTPELGLRMILGLTKFGTMRLVLGFGFRLGVVGVLMGSVGGHAATRLLAAAMPEVSMQSGLLIGILASLMLAITALACWLPASRATRVEPMAALRWQI